MPQIKLLIEGGEMTPNPALSQKLDQLELILVKLFQKLILQLKHLRD
jgi:ribosomal protein L11